jgi:hypothetical protein
MKLENLRRGAHHAMGDESWPCEEFLPRSTYMFPLNQGGAAMKWSRIFIAALVVFFPSLANAAMIELSVEDLSRSSDAVIVGEVREITSGWNDAQTLITTRVSVLVEEAVIGKADGMVVVEFIGGEVGEVGLRVSGMPSFQFGERVFLFLEAYPGSTSKSGVPTYELTGMFQGKIPIISQETGKSRVVLGGTDMDLQELIRRVKGYADE